MVKVFPLIRNKSVLTSRIKHCTSNFSVIRQEEKKKGYLDWKGRNKTASIHRQNYLFRKSRRTYTKTPKINK